MNDTSDRQGPSAQDVAHWREERHREEERRLVLWLDRAQTALAVLVPVLGLLWAWSLLQRRNLQTRTQGAYLGGWALLGIIIWAVVWSLWGDSLAKLVWTPLVRNLGGAGDWLGR